MATRLSTTAVTARKVIKYGLVVFVLFLIVRAAFLAALNAYIASLPPKIPPPTVGFNKLPAIPFPLQKNELPDLEYKVETASGFLPEFPDQMKVFAFLPQVSNFNSFDKMVETAKVFGFTGNPIKLNNNPNIVNRNYKFNHTRVPSTIDMDSVTGAFSISFNLAADPTPLLSPSRSADSAIDIIKDRLNEAKILNDDLSGQISHIYLKASGQNLSEALSLSEADLVQVNLFRRNIDSVVDERTKEVKEVGFPIKTADPNKANVWFIVSGSSEKDKEIISGEYRYFPYDANLVETYPIKTPEEALRDLVNGEGYVANIGRNLDGNITLTQIYLSYYDPAEPSEFLQPIVVFEGRDEFLAYVSAVKKDYIKLDEEN